VAAFDDEQDMRRLRDHFRGALSSYAQGGPVDTPFVDDGLYFSPNQTFRTPSPTAQGLPPARAYAGGGGVRRLLSAFHGSNSQFDHFDPKKLGNTTGLSTTARDTGWGHHFSDDPVSAARYGAPHFGAQSPYLYDVGLDLDPSRVFSPRADLSPDAAEMLLGLFPKAALNVDNPGRGLDALGKILHAYDPSRASRRLSNAGFEGSTYWNSFGDGMNHVIFPGREDLIKINKVHTDPAEIAGMQLPDDYAGGGVVDDLDYGENPYEARVPGDDYGAGRFTRTPAELRVARERRRDWTPPTDLSDDWGAREWDRFIGRHKGHPATYAMDALSRLDNWAAQYSPSDTARYVFDALNPIQHDLQDANPGWGSRLGDATLSALNFIPGFKGISASKQIAIPVLANVAAGLGQVGGEMLGDAIPTDLGEYRFGWSGAPGFGQGGSVGKRASDILRPAIRAGGRLFKAQDHTDAIPKMMKAFPDEVPEVPEFGFLDHRGRFLDRETASQFARDNGLLADDTPAEIADLPLTSELLRAFGKRNVEGFREGGSTSAALKAVAKKFGAFQGSRAERAADEGLLDRYSQKGIESVFNPKFNGLYTSMPPGDFEDYALRLPQAALDKVPYPRWERMMPRSILRRTPEHERTLDNYLDHMADRIQSKGIDSASDAASLPTLWLSKNLDDLTEINSHEGRHRMRTLDRLGDPRALVRMQPASDGELLRPVTEGGSVEAMVERLLGKYFPHGPGTMMIPEQPDLVPRLPRSIYSQPFKDGGTVRAYQTGGKGAVKFVKNLYEALSPEKREALDRIAKVTGKTKNEALIFGTEGEGLAGLSALTPGTATSVKMPEWASQFVYDAQDKGLPWFSAHTHPTGDPQPSLPDLSAWRAHPPHAGSMLIHGVPNRSVLEMGALRPDQEDVGTSLVKAKAALNARMVPPEVSDFALGSGLRPITPTREASSTLLNTLDRVPILDMAARLGVPVQLSADMNVPGAKPGNLVGDVYPEFLKYMRSKNVNGDIFGYDKGGSVLTRIAREIAGKPKTFKLPSGEVHDAAPVAELEDIAAKFARRSGNDYPVDSFPKFDEARARRIAEAYDAMAHDPNSPEVRRAYEALIDETMDQYRALDDLGLNFHFMRPGEADPYAASPALGYLDLVDNGRLTVFPTEQGFGSINDISNNPLLRRVGRVGDLDNATANDAFRVVHDTLGHFGPGNPFFRHQGEERAWMLHGRAYSPDALPAATSETRGQNSWVNFGPYGERNRSASGADTTYADQKTGLMPEWTWIEKAIGGPVQAFGAGDLVKKTAKGAAKSWRTKTAEELEAEVRAANRGAKPSSIFNSPEINPRLQTVDDPRRVAFPLIYSDPKDIVSWAKEAYSPDAGRDNPMFRLFGHTRQSLDELSRDNKPFDLPRPNTPDWAAYIPKSGEGAAVAPQVTTRRNANRIIDVLGLGLEDPDLKTMRSWYELGPLWERMNRLGMSDRDMRNLNTRMGVMSPEAMPDVEVGRGFMANYLLKNNRFDDFARYGGVPGHLRSTEYGVPEDMLWSMGHKNHDAHMAGLMENEFAGRLWPGERNKVNTYVAASDPILPLFGMPVADSHWSRMLGLPDVRTSTRHGGVKKNASNPEYQIVAPWWNRKVADAVDEYPRDAQALAWGLFGPTTGVRKIGVPKLEIIAKHIDDVARAHGMDPLLARDRMLTGELGGFAEGGSVDTDDLLYHPFMFAEGGSVDDDMQAYMSQHYEAGGPVRGYFS
jgi:proteasome lid subunit RPN8/RPN11